VGALGVLAALIIINFVVLGVLGARSRGRQRRPRHAAIR
jgi:hypothetical protein